MEHRKPTQESLDFGVIKSESVTKLLKRIRELIPGAIPLHIDRAAINVLIDVLDREFDVKARDVNATYLDTIMPRIEMWSTDEQMKQHQDIQKLKEYDSAPRYMTVNNSSWHMTIFPKYYSNLVSVSQQMDQEEQDPMCYSSVSVVWDIDKKEALYVWHDKPEPIIPTQEDWDIYRLEKDKDDIRKQKELEERLARQKIYEETVKMQMDIVRKAAEKEEMYKLYVRSCIEQKPEPLIPVSIWDFDADKCMIIKDGAIVAINKIAADVDYVSTVEFAKNEMQSTSSTWDRIRG